MRVKIVLKRRSAFYTVIFVLPVILITSIALLGMFTPSSKSHDRTEKCSLGLTSLLTIAVILLMVADMVPKSDTQTFPLLGKFCIYEIVLNAVATFVAVVIMCLHSHADFTDRSPPQWLLWITALPDQLKKDDADHEENEKLAGSRGMVVENTHRTKQLHANAQNAELVGILKKMHQSNELIRKKLVNEKRLEQQWNRVCFRLDLIMLTTTEFINLITFVWWLLLSAGVI